MKHSLILREDKNVAELQEFDLWSNCGLHLWSNCGLIVVYMWSTCGLHLPCTWMHVLCACAAARSARKRVAAPSAWESTTSTVALRLKHSLSSGGGVPGARGGIQANEGERCVVHVQVHAVQPIFG